MSAIITKPTLISSSSWTVLASIDANAIEATVEYKVYLKDASQDAVVTIALIDDGDQLTAAADAFDNKLLHPKSLVIGSGANAAHRYYIEESGFVLKPGLRIVARTAGANLLGRSHGYTAA